MNFKYNERTGDLYEYFFRNIYLFGSALGTLYVYFLQYEFSEKSVEIFCRLNIYWILSRHGLCSVNIYSTSSLHGLSSVNIYCTTSLHGLCHDNIYCTVSVTREHILHHFTVRSLSREHILHLFNVRSLSREHILHHFTVRPLSREDILHIFTVRSLSREHILHHFTVRTVSVTRTCTAPFQCTRSIVSCCLLSDKFLTLVDHQLLRCSVLYLLCFLIFFLYRN